MLDPDAIPELKQVLGALIFGANRPLSINDIRRCLSEVGHEDSAATVFADLKTGQIRSALNELGRDIEKGKIGFLLNEVAAGFRLQSIPPCGRWLKQLLQVKPQRLSRPSLETLAIIAYRQPITRADIESIRGVSVGHVIKTLMEMHLVKLAGRSELPGKPFLYATTQAFLDHFGIKSVKDMAKMGPTTLMRRRKAEAAAAQKTAEADEAAEPEAEETVATPPAEEQAEAASEASSEPPVEEQAEASIEVSPEPPAVVTAEEITS